MQGKAARRIGGGRRIGTPTRKKNYDSDLRKFNLFLEKYQAFPIETKITKITLNSGSEEYPLNFDQKPKYIKSCNVFYVSTPKIEEFEAKEKSASLTTEEVKIRAEDQIVNRNKKAEKKFRSQMIKNGVSNQPQFQNVTVTFDLIREIWTQEEAELYRVPGGYLIFGRLDVENRQQTTAKEFFNQQIKDLDSDQTTIEEEDTEAPELVEQKSEEELVVADIQKNAGAGSQRVLLVPRQKRPPTIPDDLRQEDVSLVVSQTNCSQEQAISALKASKGDIVNAIMTLC